MKTLIIALVAVLVISGCSSKVGEISTPVSTDSTVVVVDTLALDSIASYDNAMDTTVN